MAYADVRPGGPIPAQPPIKSRPPVARRKKRPAPRQSAVWPARPYAEGSIVAAASCVGRAIRAGLLDDTPRRREPSRTELLLTSIDRSPEVRRCVGRVDTSGRSDAAAFALATGDDAQPIVELYYRYGREVLVDLAAIASRLFEQAGWKVRRLVPRIERARAHGASAWVAIFPLIDGATG